MQKFEEPTSPYNTLIRAYWTPHKVFPRGTWVCFQNLVLDVGLESCRGGGGGFL